MIIMQICFPGCVANTPVFNGEYLTVIRQLRAGDTLVGMTNRWQLVYTKMRHRTVSRKPEKVITLKLYGNEQITIGEHQKFLLFDTCEWVCAHKLYPGSRLVRMGVEPCIVRDIITDISEELVYEIDVGHPHTFFISKWFVLTHNADLTLAMSQVTTDGILASIAATSTCTTVAAMLATCGIKATVSGGMLSLSAPISMPVLVAAFTGACIGLLGYRMYQWWYGILSLHNVHNMVMYAEQAKPMIPLPLQAEYQQQLQQCVPQSQSIQQASSMHALQQQLTTPEQCPPVAEGADDKKDQSSQSHVASSLLYMDDTILLQYSFMGTQERLPFERIILEKVNEGVMPLLSLTSSQDVLSNRVHPEIEKDVAVAKKSLKPPHRVLVYHVADYHRPVSFFDIDRYMRENVIGRKSPCPTKIEGQLILSFLSFEAGERHRIAYVLGKIISFKITARTSHSIIYHGHFCLDGVSSMSRDMKDALEREGIINGKGRIIK